MSLTIDIEVKYDRPTEQYYIITERSSLKIPRSVLENLSDIEAKSPDKEDFEKVLLEVTEAHKKAIEEKNEEIERLRAELRDLKDSAPTEVPGERGVLQRSDGSYSINVDRRAYVIPTTSSVTIEPEVLASWADSADSWVTTSDNSV